MAAAFQAAEAAQASTMFIAQRTWRHMLSQRLARLSGKEIGEACDCDHTQASRIASGQRGATIEQWCRLLDAMGLKIVSKEKTCISPERLRFLEQTTGRALANEQVAAMLWEEPE